MPNSLNYTKNHEDLYTDVELIIILGNSAVADVTRDRKGLNEVPAVSAVRGLGKKNREKSITLSYQKTKNGLILLIL